MLVTEESERLELRRQETPFVAERGRVHSRDGVNAWPSGPRRFAPEDDLLKFLYRVDEGCELSIGGLTEPKPINP
jgi:hypothetical protein